VPKKNVPSASIVRQRQMLWSIRYSHRQAGSAMEAAVCEADGRVSAREGGGEGGREGRGEGGTERTRRR